MTNPGTGFTVAKGVHAISPSIDDGRRQMTHEPDSNLARFLEGFSIEVMPRTAAKIRRFRDIIPSGTRVYVAHIEGTPIQDMVATAMRIRSEGFPVMPHFPARIIKDRATLRDWIVRYREDADIDQALLLAGGVKKPVGDFSDSMQLLESGLFGDAGFRRLHVAGHPEGNPDIDPDGSTAGVDRALEWKQKFSESTDAEMAIATQFCFDATPVIHWLDRLRDLGVTLPVHVGVAGPAKLQTLIRFAVACGVGQSLQVLRKRARDIRKLLTPFEPDEFLNALADYDAGCPESGIEAVHFFPLGGIMACTDWVAAHREAGAAGELAARKETT